MDDTTITQNFEHMSLAELVRLQNELSQVLIPTDTRFTPVQPLSRHSPLTSLARDVKRPRNLAPRADQWPEKFPVLDRGLACLTTRLTQQYSSCRRKRVFIFPIPVGRPK